VPQLTGQKPAQRGLAATAISDQHNAHRHHECSDQNLALKLTRNSVE
jgi:hypothetical protein